MWTTIGIGVAVVVILVLYFYLRMPKCPLCKQRGPVYPEMYGGYYCTHCDHSFDPDQGSV